MFLKKCIFFVGIVLIHAEVFSSARLDLFQNSLGLSKCVAKSNPKFPIFLTKASCERDLLDKKELEYFFRHMCTKSTFGYTIFGEKPMTFYDYFISPPQDFLIHTSIFEPRFEKWYEIYLKYRPMFSTEKFLVVDQLFISKKFSTSGKVRDLIIINKESFRKTILANQALFNERLGYDIDPENLLRRIEAGESVLQKVLNEDEVLWGILLGYGVHNATMFERWEQIRDDHCLLNSSFESLEHERNHFETHFFGTYDSDTAIISKISFPGFIADRDHCETSKLLNDYRNVHAKLCEIIDKPDFCDLILEQLGYKLNN